MLFPTPCSELPGLIDMLLLLLVLVVLLLLLLVVVVLTLSEGVQRQAGLARLDGEQALPLEVEQMLLLDLLDLQELLLEGQLLRRHLLLVVRTHARTCTTQMER